MKATRWYKAKDIRVENIEEPVIAPGKVKIKVHWTGFVAVIYMNTRGQSLFQWSNLTM